MTTTRASAQIRDLMELEGSLRQILDRMRTGDKEAAETSLRFARGLVNISTFLEPHAKAILTAIFAEIHSILDPSSTDCDVLFENFIRSMEFIYGADHIVMSDCFTMLSSFYANCDRIPLAIDYAGRALVNRISSVGLMHFATANSHFNLGLLYRLDGELIKSKKEFRICRSIRSELFGEESLEVAATDLSLGQTERLLISYDKSYLHFYLSFHTRAVILGPSHPDTLRSYNLLSDIRYAYSDRLLTSVELLDRIDELSWFHLGDDESDLFSVVSSLLTHLYAARATALQNGLTMHYKGGIETAGGNTGTMLGDCIVLRESLLESLIRESVVHRIQSVLATATISSLVQNLPQTGVSDQGAVSEWNNRLSQRGRPPPPPSSKYLSLPFNSLTNADLLTKEIVAWLLHGSQAAKARGQLSRQPAPSRFGSAKPEISLTSLSLSTDQINFYESKRIAKQKADALREPPLGVKQKTKELVEKNLDAILAVVSPNEETKATPISERESPKTQTPIFLPPKTPPPPLPLTEPPMRPPGNPLPPTKKSNPTKTPETAGGRVESKKAPSPQEPKKEKVPKATKVPAEPLKISVTELAVPTKPIANRNKAFLSVAEDPPGGRASSEQPGEKNLLMPRLGSREVLITRDLDGRGVSIRPVSGRDLLDGLRVKIFAAGIFPYLLLTDLEAVERSKREILSPMPPLSSERKSVRFQAEEMIRELDRLKKEEEARRQAEEEARLAEEKKVAQERLASQKKESEEKEREQKKNEEKAKKPIPRPPPLPSCWPPQVVDGKNVGGDSSGGAAFGMPGGGEGRGGLLGALLGGRGGGGRGGPLAFLRRKSGTMFKPAGPKLKQLHWDTLDSTEGTLWAEDSKIGMTISDDTFADLAEVFAPAQKKDPSVKAAKDMPGAVGLPGSGKNKPVAVLDGQKSQNMNIMLAKFGSKTKLSDIIEAIVTLRLASFSLGILSTMLEFTPLAFADTGEVEAIRTAANTHGIEKLGKAERYLLELSKIPRVENYLRVMALLLSLEDIKKQTLRAATVIFSVVEEIRGSNRFKVMLQSILRIGNVLNQGTKKSGATGFKIASLAKLTQTKSNSGETVLEYLVVRMGREMPDVLDLKADMPSLEEAKFVSFPTLQLDIAKVESGLKVLSKHKEDMRSSLEKGKDTEDGAVENPAGHSREIYDRVCRHEAEVTQVLDAMRAELQRAQQSHADLCVFLGEDSKQDPEGLYGQILAFVCSLEAVIAKKLKRL